MAPHKELANDCEHFSWFMAFSRARQLLAAIEKQPLATTQNTPLEFP